MFVRVKKIGGYEYLYLVENVLKSDHYKKYAAAAKDIVAKREVHPLSSVVMMKK